MNCGVCSAICPMGVEVQPRVLFRYVLLGMEERVTAGTEPVFSCLLCKMCEENCPRACTSPRTCAPCAITSTVPSSVFREG